MMMEKSLAQLCKPGQSVHRLALGLTGNPGAGKSAVARLLQDHGAIVLEGDAVGYRMLAKDSPVFSELVDAFGKSVLDEQGGIDRKKLGAVVFQDEAQLQHLNKIVHPPMLQHIRDEIERFRAGNAGGPFVLDAALVYEWNIADCFDGVIVVAAPVETRHRRFLQSRGGSAESLAKREASQLPQEEKIKRADIVIENNDGIDALQHKVRKLFTNF